MEPSDEANHFILVEIPDEGGQSYALYEVVAGPIVPGSDGVPQEAVDWLFQGETLRAVRLLPEQARKFREKAPTIQAGSPGGG